MALTRTFTIVLALGLTGCVPMTFSHEAAIDFARYRSVRVSVDAPLLGASDYLATQLREVSGFEKVTTSSSASTDLVLSVDVSVAGNADGRYDSNATYVAKTPGGAVVDQGVETDTSDTDTEAAEDVLDQVAAHYQRPFRL